MIADYITASFSVIGMLVIIRSIVLLSKQRMVRGVSLWQAEFFATWSVWNLFFYHSLGLWWSWYGAVGIAVTNVTWVCMLCTFKFIEFIQDFFIALDSEMSEEEWYYVRRETVDEVE